MNKVQKSLYVNFKNLSRNFAGSATQIPKSEKRIGNPVPLITCKRPEFNLYRKDCASANSKFGSIKLASDHWDHRRSTRDYFIIQSHLEPGSRNAASPSIDGDTFNSFPIDSRIQENISKEFSFENCTRTQSVAIPKILAGNHCLIAAETGCGKTLAYLIPIIQQIWKRKMHDPVRDFNSPIGLVLTPGRELAHQIGEVAEKLCKNLDINVKVLCGGRTKQKMMNPSFEGFDLLIGTIGAISKLVTTGIYRMDQVRHVVLDEADTLLDDSFFLKLGHFLQKFPFYKIDSDDLTTRYSGTQMILCSATMPTNIEEILQNIIDPKTIKQAVSPNLHRLLPHVPQRFLRMSKSKRPEYLLKLVQSELKEKRPIIVFANRSPTSDYVSMYLRDNGVENVNLNGDMQMVIRLGQFERFQNGEADVLSTTDVGSRGLDTKRARHIINFDFPLHIADYIHRLGRIGRASNFDHCICTNFVSGYREINVVRRIEHAARTMNPLTNVDGNITNIIKKRIMREIGEGQQKLNI